MRNARVSRIASMKDEIHARGCVVSINYQDREMWVKHLATGWKSYVRYAFRDLGAVEETWEQCRDIAISMDYDFHAGKI